MLAPPPAPAARPAVANAGWCSCCAGGCRNDAAALEVFVLPVPAPFAVDDGALDVAPRARLPGTFAPDAFAFSVAAFDVFAVRSAPPGAFAPEVPAPVPRIARAIAASVANDFSTAVPDVFGPGGLAEAP